MIFDALGSLALGQAFTGVSELMTSILTSAELAYMRDSTELLMPDTCNILTLSIVSNDEGGQIETWSTTGTSECRLDMKSGSEPVLGGAVQEFTGYVLSIPYDTVINDENRVEIDSVIYAVTSINDGQSWRAVKRVTLEVVE
jgi:SPP1 family predicted phage head-tail adaptor